MLDGGAGADTLSGGAGDDIYIIENLGDLVFEEVGGGYDRVYALATVVLSQSQEIEIVMSGGPDPLAPIGLVGNNYDNELWGNAGDNSLFGFAGHDNLIGFEGNDYLDAGADADFLAGGTGDDVYVVDNAGDVVVEGAGQGLDKVYATIDYTLAWGTSVEILAAGGSDPNAPLQLTGNELANNLWGNAGNNLLSGAEGDDALFGFDGNDDLFGGAGSNFLVGGAGSDNLFGGTGADTLVGEAGADSFLFYNALGPGNVDVIADFAPVDDLIVLGSWVFAGLAPGALAAAAFHTGTAAHDADDRIVYDQASGALLYDADGTGAIAAIQFATLNTQPALTTADFLVV
jgi:Ca2+-binding RTX toxin-like protein